MALKKLHFGRKNLGTLAKLCPLFISGNFVSFLLLLFNCCLCQISHIYGFRAPPVWPRSRFHFATVIWQLAASQLTCGASFSSQLENFVIWSRNTFKLTSLILLVYVRFQFKREKKLSIEVSWRSGQCVCVHNGKLRQLAADGNRFWRRMPRVKIELEWVTKGEQFKAGEMEDR